MSAGARPKPVFPLIRHLSAPISRLLIRTPFSANQITTASLGFGLAAAWSLSYGVWERDVMGGLLLVVCYVLDNCDGEIARAKNQCSRFGMYFDGFVDWAVHTALFIGIGFGATAETHFDAWMWMGVAAAAGGTINYVAGLILAARESGADEPEPTPAPEPSNFRQWIVFAFRELSRADFCFIVLAIALFDIEWIILPLGAVGAHVYWATLLIPAARRYHV